MNRCERKSLDVPAPMKYPRLGHKSANAIKDVQSDIHSPRLDVTTKEEVGGQSKDHIDDCLGPYHPQIPVGERMCATPYLVRLL